MSKMPLKARIYWMVVLLAGVLAAVLSQILPLPRLAHTPLDEVAIFAVLALVFGGQKITLKRLRTDDEAMSMTLGFAITFASLLRLGPVPTVPISILSCLSSCLYPKPQKAHQLIFNVCLSSLEALVGGIVFVAINNGTEPGVTFLAETGSSPALTFLAVTGSSLSFFLVNTLGVAVMISLVTKEKVLQVWNENFAWTAPSYFASACMGAIAMLLFKGSSVAIVLFTLPIAYVVYRSFATYVARAEDRQRHIEELQGKQAELADLYLATIKSLALAIDAKDQYTHQHIVRVQRYAVAIAEEMGMQGDELQGVRTGALLHDIGKLGVPEYVLLKPGPLTPEEFDKIKMHPEIGAAILDPVEFPWPVLPAVKHHHERWDGSGYPDGLKGEDIPMTARIMAVADVYDAVTSTRSYRRACNHEEGVEIIREGAGKLYDAQVVAAFLNVIERVVHEMAEEGTGPLVQKHTPPKIDDSKSLDAARHISRASTELLALFEVTQSLSSRLGMKDTGELIVKKIEEIYSGSTCAFLLWDADARALHIESVAGMNLEFFVGARTRGPSSTSVKVVEGKKCYLGPFEPDDLMLAASRVTAWTPLVTSLIVPVWHEGVPLGAINLYRPAEDPLTDYDRQLLELIGERAAAALHNGLLFDRTRGDSLRDELTGVHNHRSLLQHLNRLCAEPDSGFSILALDLDSFKPINDGFGHAKGDVVLRDVAALFSQVVGSEGIVARYGGDEFVVVLAGANEKAAHRMASRLQEAAEKYDPHLYHQKLGRLRIGVSVGIACFPVDGLDGASLLSAADHKMYAIKTEQKLQGLATSAEHSNVNSIPEPQTIENVPIVN